MNDESCSFHSKKFVLNGYRIFTFSLIFLAVAGDGSGRDLSTGQGTLAKLKNSAKTDTNSGATSKPRMVVKSPYKPNPGPLKEKLAHQRKQNDEDLPKTKASQPTPEKISESSKNDQPKSETLPERKINQPKTEPQEESSAVEPTRSSLRPNTGSPGAQQVRSAGELRSVEKSEENKKERTAKTSDPLPNFYISATGANSDLSRSQSSNLALEAANKIKREDEVQETAVATEETPKIGIGAQWLPPKNTPSSSRQVLQSAFSSDYQNRRKGEVLPAVLDGAGYNGADLPIGQEDTFRLATLPSQFRPTDLVHIPPQHCFSRSDIYLRREAAASLVRMFNDAAKEGLAIKIFSGYRDFSHQQRLYTQAVAKNGQNQKGVARPGRSEHQLGTTADVTNGAKHLLSRSFQDTPEGKWLARNAAKYGWKMTVMAGEGRRSHSDEPWHIRYLGANVHNYQRGAASTYQIAAQPTPRPKKGLLSSLGGLLKK